MGYETLKVDRVESHPNILVTHAEQISVQPRNYTSFLEDSNLSQISSFSGSTLFNHKNSYIKLWLMSLVFLSLIFTTFSYDQAIAQNRKLAQIFANDDSNSADRSFTTFEGISVKIRILVNGTPHTSMSTIKVFTTETSGDVLADEYTGELMYSIASKQWHLLDFTIPTKRNLTSTTGGQFTIAVRQNDDYGPFPNFDTYTIEIENYDPPALSAEPSPSINEGSDAVFNLSSTAVPSGNTIPVKFHLYHNWKFFKRF